MVDIRSICQLSSVAFGDTFSQGEKEGAPSLDGLWGEGAHHSGRPLLPQGEGGWREPAG
jgi:hypothetical protein